MLAALPDAPEGVAEERRAHALPAPRATRVEHVDPAATVRVAPADRPRGDLVPGADDAPERRVEALAPEVELRPRLEVARREVPAVRERVLVRGVELERVTHRVERDNAQPVRPLGWGRRRVELDAQLAEDAHGAVAKRLEQPAGGGVGLQDGVLDPACAAACRVVLEPGRDQPPDPPPVNVGVDVPLDAPELGSLAHQAVADDALAVPEDARVLLELEVRPLVLQIGLRERALAVKRRFERDDDLDHAAASAATAGVGKTRSMPGGMLRAADALADRPGSYPQRQEQRDRDAPEGVTSA